MLSITGKTKLLGVIGDPVEHSLSPVMHNAAIAKLGVDYVYIGLPVKTADLAAAMAGFNAIGLVGFNITIPHKQAIIPYLTEVSQIAKQVGAVNTVWQTDKGWQGTNTDVQGFISPLLELEEDWHQIVPIILGNGGVSRAVVVGCEQLGCPEIIIVGRNEQKLEQYKASWQNTGLKASIKVYPWQELANLISKTELLVNTTPLGMYPHTEASPLNKAVLEQISSDLIAYDLIYRPKMTKFLQQAQQKGAVTINGLEMLVQQGAAALEIWLQQSVPVEVMSQALINALDDE